VINMNILSVDLDYAFSPAISSYDDFVEGHRISLEAQKAIFERENLPPPTVNLAKLNLLRRVVSEKVSENADIILAANHHSIMRYLPLGSPFSVTNFDHHHDIYYPGWHSLDTLDEGNWVYWAYKQGLTNYVWYRNSDSEDYEVQPDISLKMEERLQVGPLSVLPKFDLVFGCWSPHWTGDTGKSLLLDVFRHTS